MSFNYIIPIIIIIISNVVYHVTTKNIPKEANSFFENKVQGLFTTHFPHTSLPTLFVAS